MKTNHLMLQELLRKYHPKERGILSVEEHKLINETLHISEMGILDLRNLRDFTILSLGRSENLEDWDKMSAITCCIDCAIDDLGGEL